MNNILFFIGEDNTSLGGAEDIMRQIALYHVNLGDNVHILFRKPLTKGDWEKDKCDNLNLYYGGGLKKFISNIKVLRNTTFAYSFTSLVYLTGIIGLLKRVGILKIRQMVARESTSTFARFKGLKLQQKKIMYRLSYPAVNILICQTSFMKEQLLQNLPWIEKRTKVLVIPNPVNFSLMKQKGKCIINDDQYGNYIVSAGRFIPEKGFDILIDSFSILIKNFPKLNLVILGDGKLREDLLKQVEYLNLTDHVFFPGFVTNVYPFFKNAKMCVVSSRLEGFPNVLLQMMSQNNHVASTLCAGDIEHINGLQTCKPNNVNELYKCMLRCLQSTESNLQLFEKELRKRNIQSYVQKIETPVNNCSPISLNK